MKVLIVNTYHYLRGGDCRHAFGLGRLLREAGHEVHFFGMKDDRNQVCDDDAYFVSNIDFDVALRQRNLLHAVRVLGRSIYSREARRKISSMLEDLRPDIVHMHSIRHHLTKSILPEMGRRKVPVVWTLHDYKEICPNTSFFDGIGVCEACRGGRYYHALTRRCKRGSLAASAVTFLEAQINAWLGYDRHVDLFVSPSGFLRDKFIEFGYPGWKIVSIPNFIELDRYSPDYTVGAYLLYLGRLEKMKGLDTLIEGFGRACLDTPGLALKIAGTGTMEKDLRSSVEQKKLRGIEMLGHVGGAELEALIRGARAVVIPSVWYENYPYSCLEAMAYGKPVIASRIGGIPEQVEEGVTGFLFEPGDSRELAGRIVGLYNMGDDQVEEMGKAGRVRVEGVNSPERYLGSILEVYRQVMAKRKPWVG
jgi:glycosyltransferase involved in cell wall biosynthesis